MPMKKRARKKTARKRPAKRVSPAAKRARSTRLNRAGDQVARAVAAFRADGTISARAARGFSAGVLNTARSLIGRGNTRGSGAGSRGGRTTRVSASGRSH